MAGLKIVLPTVFSDKSLPVLRTDAILPGAGALMLLEPKHPASQWAAGVPASGAVLPNIAKETADPLLGVGARATVNVHPSFTGDAGKLERSSKGGLHGIVSQTASVAGVGATIELPAALKKYLFDRPTNDMYVSLWSRVTRNPTASADFATQMHAPGADGGYMVNFTHAPTGANSGPNSGPSIIGMNYTSPRLAGGASRHSIALSGWTATPTNLSAFRALAANWASGTDTNNGSVNKASSWVFYRFYLEDLTVSKRTWAELDALDNELFTKEVMTAGGRYYGDTFTNPTTIP